MREVVDSGRGPRAHKEVAMTNEGTNDESHSGPWVLSVRIPRDIEPRIRQVAKRRTVPPAILIRQLVVERLEQIEHDGERAERQ